MNDKIVELEKQYLALRGVPDTEAETETILELIAHIREQDKRIDELENKLAAAEERHYLSIERN